MSDNEYTPLEHEARSRFIAGSAEIIRRRPESVPDSGPSGWLTPSEAEGVAGAEFDRWLAAHDREVAAKAWGEGLHVAYNHVGRLEDAEAAGQGVTIPDPVNPYRAALGVPVSPESEGKK